MADMFNQMTLNRKEYQREYYRTHKNHILETMYAIVECECGYHVQKQKLARHKRSKKHATMLELIKSAPTRAIENSALLIAKFSAELQKLPFEHKALIKKLIGSEQTETERQITKIIYST
jgi:hypothetical protein